MGRELRVLYVIDKMTLGGTQTHLDTVLRRIGAYRVEPVLCCLNDFGDLACALRTDGYRVVGLHSGRLTGPLGLLTVFRLASQIRRGRYDLVHSYLFSSNLVAPIAACLTGLPVVTSRRDTGFWAARRHLWAYRIVNRLTDAITVNSEAVRRATVLREGVGAAKVHRVPNGIPPQPIRSNGGCSVIGTVGNLKPVKGHATLIRAFALLARRYDRLALCLFGDGPEKARLMHTAGAVGLDGEVRFRGARASAEALGQIDIFVLPSLSEGCSNALLEAMGSGLPVVATDIPANREVIRHGIDGLLVPAHDYTAMADAIGMLIESRTLRTTLGHAAVEAARRFSVEAMLTAIRFVYDRVLDGHKRRPGGGRA